LDPAAASSTANGANYVRCRNCQERVLVPVPQPVALDAQKIKAIRWDAVEQFVKMLTTQARDPYRIGVRVKFAEFVFQEDKGFPKQLNLANELDVSSAAVSKGVGEIRDKLERILVNFSASPESPE
jgi:hypothetical protein